MARTVAGLRAGPRVTDYISLGVITKTFPLRKVRAVLKAPNKTSIRERDLPAPVVVYYVIALAQLRLKQQVQHLYPDWEGLLRWEDDTGT